MALTLSQQIIENIEQAKNILITFKKDFTGDDLVSALALKLFLKKINKPAVIVAAGFSAPTKYRFLSNIEEIQSGLKSLKKFIINLNLKNNKIDEFSYDIKDDQLQIFITPQNGNFENNNISTSSSDYRFDLIIIIGSPDLESLGETYEKNPDFFYQTTIINIDCHPENENFGQINLIDLNTSSAAEIIYKFIEAYNKQLIDSEIATLLLTGVLEATQHFRTPNLSPLILNIASQLIAIGADKEKIAANLYRTKTLATLRLWGRVLARLQKDVEVHLVWSLLNQQDFTKAGATENDIQGVVEELISSNPEAQVVVLLFEVGDKKIDGHVYAKKNYDALLLTKPFEPMGTKSKAIFHLTDLTLFEVERQVIEEVRKRIKTIR